MKGEHERKRTRNETLLVQLIRLFEIPRLFLVSMVILLLLRAGAELSQLWFASKLVDMSTFSAGFDRSTLRTSIQLTLIILFEVSLGFFLSWLLGVYIARSLQTVRCKMVNRLTVCDSLNMASIGSGQLTSRLTSDVDQVKKILSNWLGTSIYRILMLLLAIIIGVRVSWLLTICMVASVPLVIWLSMQVGRFIEPAARAARSEADQTIQVMQEALWDVPQSRGYQAEQLWEDHIHQRMAQRLKADLKLSSINAALQALMPFVGALPVLVLFTIGGIQLAYGTITAGQMVVFIMLLGFIANGIGALPELIGDTKVGGISMSRIRELLNLVLMADAGIGKLPEASGLALQAEHVRFRYAADQNEVLQDVSFELPRGVHAVLIGPSGSGKTTLFRL